ncbi:hypothetical protein [Legionella sp. 29fVS95]|uniref:hypothetical protein n=1 Tax=Legionella sp. 29fVS95 TaxID=3402813 RepID=UPI003AF9F51C
MSEHIKPAKLVPLSTNAQSEQIKSAQMKQAVQEHRQQEESALTASQSKDGVRLTQSQESSLPSQRPEEDTLTLNTHQGKVTLTESEVEEWFANTEKALMTSQDKTGPVTQQANDRELGAKFLSRFGLKSAKDVIQFLNSPAGDTVKETIAAKWSEKEAIKAERAFEQREKEALRKRRLAYFLAGVMMHKAAKAKELNRAYAEAGQKAIERSKENATGGTSYGASETSAAAHAAALSQQLAAYQNVIDALENQLTDKQAQEAAITSQIAAIQQKYQALGNHVAQAHTHIAQALSKDLSHDKVIDAYDIRIQYIENQLKQKQLDHASFLKRSESPVAKDRTKYLDIAGVISKESHDLETLLLVLKARALLHRGNKGLTPISDEDRIEVIESNAAKLDDKIHLDLKVIHELLQDGDIKKEQQAMAMIQEHQGLVAEMVTLKEMIAVLKGEKILVKKDGTETMSYKDAAYILSPGQRVVKDQHGKSYLLTGHQSLDNMTPNEKDKAHDKLRSVATIDKLLHHNEKLELGKKQQELKQVHKEIHDLRDQIQFMQQRKAEVNEALKALHHEPRPQPHVSGPGIFSPTPKPVPSETWLQIERLLDKLKNNPKKEDVEKLRDLIPKDNSKLQNLITRFGKALNANAQIEMQRYLQTIEMSAVSAYKPFVTSVTSPREQESEEFQSSKESVKFHPTPFKDPYSL